MSQRRVLKLEPHRPASGPAIGATVPEGGRTVITLYGRRGCHLCDDAAAVLAELADTLHIAIGSVDVDDNDALRRRYDHHVPVVCHGDDEICRHHLDLPALERTLARVRS